VLGGIWLFTAISTLIRTRSVRTLLWPTATLVLLVGFVGVQLLFLSLNFGDRYGRYFADRSPEESEIYGGSISALLLPSTLSGIPQFAHLATTYLNGTLLLKTSEQPASAVIGSIGMVLLVAAFLVRGINIAGSARNRFSALLDDPRVPVLGTGFLWAFLFFTATGLGFVFAKLASPEVRAWSRMSIVLAMFALAFLAILVETLLRRRGWRYTALAALAVLGIADQLLGVFRNPPLNPTADSATRAYASAVVKTLPSGCGIVELPLKLFPESGAIGRMGDYDEGLVYDYEPRSGDVRWSYGSVRLTDGAAPWDSVKSPEQFGPAVHDSKACAVQVDTFAFANASQWQPWVDEVADSGQPVLQSDGGRYLLFKVTAG
jgi:hypothetical protein